MFDMTIRQMIESGNDVMMGTQLSRFKDEEEKQLRDLEQFKVDTNQAAVQKIVDIKAVRMNQKREQAKLASTQQQESNETWKANQDKAKARADVKRRVNEKVRRGERGEARRGEARRGEARRGEASEASTKRARGQRE
jgi:hypothetical protein